MMSDESLVMMALAGPQERLSRHERDHLLEFLFELRSGETLSARQRLLLHEIADKIRGVRREGG